jgi:hypothetical protein
VAPGTGNAAPSNPSDLPKIEPTASAPPAPMTPAAPPNRSGSNALLTPVPPPDRAAPPEPSASLGKHPTSQVPPPLPEPKIAMIEQPAVQIPLAPPRDAPSKLAPEDLALLLKRGDENLNQKNIATARSFYERAAQSGNPVAAVQLGKSYDPIFLKKLGVLGTPGDPVKAAGWYKIASAAGNDEAASRLRQLQKEFPPK